MRADTCDVRMSQGEELDSQKSLSAVKQQCGHTAAVTAATATKWERTITVCCSFNLQDTFVFCHPVVIRQ